MSITQRISSNRLLQQALDSVLPCGEHQLNIPLLVPSCTEDLRLMGIAFDYAMRFELKHRVLFAHEHTWIAGDALRALQFLEKKFHSSLSANTLRAIRRLRSVTPTWIQEAQSFGRNYCLIHNPKLEHLKTLARHSIRLGYLDRLVYESRTLNPNSGSADALLLDPFETGESHGMEEEIIAMVELIPHDTFEHRSPLLLNVHFGEVSRLVGGARADLIAGNTLFDIKAAKHAVVTQDMMRQVLAYWMVARKAKDQGMNHLPDVDTLGIYLARHGRIWTLKATPMLAHPNYPAAEKLLFASSAG